jgi:metal-sulfur cluster biosynthetic enzyme
MTNIKLLVSAANCLNLETLASAVHNLTTTFPRLQKVEVEFQHDVSLLPGRVLRRRRRRSIVRSLRHLEKWMGAGQRLKVTGIDNHPKLRSSWDDAKRGWYYDADGMVAFLWRSPSRIGNVGLARRGSWPMNSLRLSEGEWREPQEPQEPRE